METPVSEAGSSGTARSLAYRLSLSPSEVSAFSWSSDEAGSSDGEPFHFDSIADPQAAAIAGESKRIISFNAASRIDPRFTAIRQTVSLMEKLVGALGMAYLLSIVTGAEVLEEALAGDLGEAVKAANDAMRRILEFIGKRTELNGLSGRKAGGDISVGEEALEGGGFGKVGEEKPKAPRKDGGYDLKVTDAFARPFL